MSKPANKPGPAAERLKIDASFEDAAAQVVKATKPAKGWPKAVRPKKRKG